jgi:hypothetical protein
MVKLCKYDVRLAICILATGGKAYACSSTAGGDCTVVCGMRS